MHGESYTEIFHSELFCTIHATNFFAYHKSHPPQIVQQTVMKINAEVLPYAQ